MSINNWKGFKWDNTNSILDISFADIGVQNRVYFRNRNNAFEGTFNTLLDKPTLVNQADVDSSFAYVNSALSLKANQADVDSSFADVNNSLSEVNTSLDSKAALNGSVGVSFHADNLDVSGDIVVTGDLLCDGEIDVQTNLNVSGDITITGTSVLSILNELTAPGTVAQMKYHQTRARKEDANGNISPYLLFTQGDTTIPDVHIDLMDISITPKKAGNAILCQWNINYNIVGDPADYIFIVKRNDGTSSTTLPFSQDSSGAYWTGISTVVEETFTSRGTNLEIKIVDEDCLATATTYELYARVTDSEAETTNLYLNGPGAPAPRLPTDLDGNSSLEGTLSTATLTEIRA